MKKNILILLAMVVMAWIFFHHPKANWEGRLAPGEPSQISDHLPLPWAYKEFTITARAQYHIKAVILSKNYFWGGDPEDALSSYDFALGWGPMSDAHVINQLHITQSFRWYHFSWRNNPPIAQSEITSHSSNHHIIAADQNVLDAVAHFKRYDLVELEGYLVDVQNNKDNWSWHTSLSRTDTGGGACEIFWVTRAFSLN